jgi:hypothetical protein
MIYPTKERTYERLSIDDFEARVRDFTWRRRITSFHLHHTADRVATWRGLASVRSTWAGHKRRQMVDLAMHALIDPDGYVWIGRDWNMMPASARGHNGTQAAGPFMIECWGDFRNGCDEWAGPERESAERVCAAICAHAGLNPLDPLSVIAHKEIDKTACPGDIDMDEFELAVARRLNAEGVEVAEARALPAANFDHPPEITREGEAIKTELSTQRIVQSATLAGSALTGAAGIFKWVPQWAVGVMVVALVAVGALWALRSFGIIKRSV